MLFNGERPSYKTFERFINEFLFRHRRTAEKLNLYIMDHTHIQVVDYNAEALATLTSMNAEQVVSSRVVAEKFEKEHKNVIAAIRGLDCSPEFNRLSFKPVEFVDQKWVNAGQTIY